MWNIDYDLKKMLTPRKEGYEFIKTLKLYIPHKEIGLQLLVRKELLLPFFYEIILKLIDCKCNEIDNISDYIGVEKDILNDVVGEMSELVYINSNILTLTPNGRNALNNLKQVVIEKEDMNRVFINSITGKISELEHVLKRPTDDNPCLTELIRISDEFIRINFNSFNEYYKCRQEEYDTKGLGLRNEIYQVIGKRYERLCYSEIKAFTYKNVRDNSLMYECEDDPDKMYGTTFAKQISNCTGARKTLKSFRSVQKYIRSEFVEDIEKAQNTEELISIVANNSYSKQEAITKIDECYFKDRYLLENEYMEILLSVNKIRPSEVIISSDCLNKILNHNIVASLHLCLDNSSVNIISCDSEYKIEELKNKVINVKGKKKNKLKWIGGENINQTDIVIYPHCAINIMYIPISIDRDYIMKEVAQITFDIKTVNEIKEKLLKN